MITYHTNETHNGVTVQIPKLLTIPYSKQALWGDVRAWCEANCNHSFYMAPGWLDPMVQFECDEDAAWFALRWS